MDTGDGGANDNLFFGNDFSFAPTNGMEATFSRNTFVANRVEGSDYGLWGGYSYGSRILGNDFSRNRTGDRDRARPGERDRRQPVRRRFRGGVPVGATPSSRPTGGIRSVATRRVDDYRHRSTTCSSAIASPCASPTPASAIVQRERDFAGVDRDGASCATSSEVPVVGDIGRAAVERDAVTATRSTSRALARRERLPGGFGPEHVAACAARPLGDHRRRVGTVRLALAAVSGPSTAAHADAARAFACSGPPGRWRVDAPARRGQRVARAAARVGDTHRRHAGGGRRGRLVDRRSSIVGARNGVAARRARPPALPYEFSYERFAPGAAVGRAVLHLGRQHGPARRRLDAFHDRALRATPVATRQPRAARLHVVPPDDRRRAASALRRGRHDDGERSTPACTRCARSATTASASGSTARSSIDDWSAARIGGGHRADRRRTARRCASSTSRWTGGASCAWRSSRAQRSAGGPRARPRC